MKPILKWSLVAVGVIVVVLGIWWYFGRESRPETAFITAKVSHGDVLASIGATGVVQPEEVIDVGAQVQGLIISFGKDADGKQIDYRSKVEEGMVLAQIDDTVYKADVDSAQAALDQAKAGVTRAEADLGQAKAKALQSERDWKRAQALGTGEALAQVDYDAYESAYQTAEANVGVSDAAIDQAKQAVEQAQAALKKVKRNLDYTTIKSPLKGEIIARRVNIGQTVVASLNAPSLFLIAKDLTRIQVWVAVNEADIGSINPGQPVTFTTDALPNRVFKGTVNKVRLNAQMTQNVVTYQVEVNTTNEDGKLLPYLTANVQFEVGRRTGVVLVPNAALRYVPDADLVDPAYHDALTAGTGRHGGGGAGAGAKSSSGDATTRPAHEHADSAWSRGRIWVRDGKLAKPISVRVGLSDGTYSEIQTIDGDALEDGTDVVIGDEVVGGAGGNYTNPFTPTMKRRTPGGGGGGGGGGGRPGGGGGR